MSEDQDDGTNRTTSNGRHPIVIPLPKAEPRPWPGRRLAAAVVLLVVAVGVVSLGMKLVDSDDDDQQAATTEAGATGFYVPGTLPTGWKVDRLETSSGAGAAAVLCPCTVTEVGRDDAGSGYVAVTSADSHAAWSGAGLPRDPLDGRFGWYEDGPSIDTVAWRTATASRAIGSSSLGRDELLALADGWTSGEPPVLDGHHVINSWSRDQPIERAHTVIWTFTNADTGQNLHVSMGAEVLGSGLLATSTVTLPGNGLPLGILPDDATAVASWPGSTDVFAMSLSDLADGDDQATPPADQTTIEAILGSFQPVDAATWSDYLTSAPRGESIPEAEPQDLAPLRTETISDWLEGPEPGTALPERTVEVVQMNPDDPSAAITVESNVDFVDVAAGDRFTIELTMTNRTGAPVDLTNRSGGTGVGGCPFGSANWSIIDENGLMTPAGAIAVDCAGETEPWPSGEQLIRTFEFPGSGPRPEEGPIAAIIDFGHVTVVVPGQVGS